MSLKYEPSSQLMRLIADKPTAIADAGQHSPAEGYVNLGILLTYTRYVNRVPKLTYRKPPSILPRKGAHVLPIASH